MQSIFFRDSDWVLQIQSFIMLNLTIHDPCVVCGGDLFQTSIREKAVQTSIMIDTHPHNMHVYVYG